MLLLSLALRNLSSEFVCQLGKKVTRLFLCYSNVVLVTQVKDNLLFLTIYNLFTEFVPLNLVEPP